MGIILYISTVFRRRKIVQLDIVTNEFTPGSNRVLNDLTHCNIKSGCYVDDIMSVIYTFDGVYYALKTRTSFRISALSNFTNGIPISLFTSTIYVLISVRAMLSFINLNHNVSQCIHFEISLFLTTCSLFRKCVLPCKKRGST